MKELVYAEIGFGNATFLSTEIEKGKKERRIPKFILPRKIDDYYIRLWVLKKVFIITTKDIFRTKNKDKNKFKLLFGIGGMK